MSDVNISPVRSDSLEGTLLLGEEVSDAEEVSDVEEVL
jgi:hypothetical protein